jgi:UDP-N-acetyl-D-mannosaminuronate dehydrogenase
MICVKVYCNGEDSQEQLENLLEDIERCVDANRVLVYDSTTNYETTEILIQSITTDEGLLAPYAVGEINLQVRYAIM